MIGFPPDLFYSPPFPTSRFGGYGTKSITNFVYCHHLSSAYAPSFMLSCFDKIKVSCNITLSSVLSQALFYKGKEMRRIKMRNKKATIILIVLPEDRYSLELILDRDFKNLHCEVAFSDNSELGALLKKAIDPVPEEEKPLALSEIFKRNRLQLMRNLAGVLKELGEGKEERRML